MYCYGIQNAFIRNLWASSYGPNQLLALGDKSGKFIYDFWMSRELNPTIGCLDLKEFFELRPGLMGWIMYVIDSLYNQRCVLTTIDIIKDGFGYMLMFGNIDWLRFYYILQARYLTLVHVELSWYQIIFVLAINIIGYIIFRQTNGQKDKFRSNPNGPALAHIIYIEAHKGRRFMTSGWRRIASYIDYFGDWVMSFSQCLACGYTNFIPDFFAVYFFILLLQSDSHSCCLKHGKYWKSIDS